MRYLPTNNNMEIPKKQEAKRLYFIPIMTECFVNHGYARTTTVEIAKACGVPQNVLYRIWPSREAMVVAAIKHIHEFRIGLKPNL